MAFGAAGALAQGGEVEWPMFQGGPGHPGSLPDGPAPPYRELWRLPAPEGRALSGAAIVDGVAYAVGDEAVYGVDVATGEIEWELPRAGGPLSVPAVVPGRGDPGTLLYLEGPDVAEGEPSPSPDDGQEADPDSASDLVAVALGDRTERWRVSLTDVSRTGVTVDGETAYVGDQGGTVHAVALEDGAVRWTTALTAPVDVPLAVAGGLVVAVARDADEGAVEVEAIDVETGERRWRLTPQGTSTAISAPAARDGVVVLGMPDRVIRALGERGGDRWAHLALSIFSPVSSPALAGDAVYLADLGGGVYRLDVADGSRAWGFQLNEVVLRSSPVVSAGAVLLGLNDGRLVAIDSGSGRLVWESERTPGLVGTIALSSEVVVAVKGGSDAGLIAFEHDPAGELVAESSPTEFDPATTLSRAALAVALTLVVVLVPGLLARRRFGEALEAEPGAVDAESEIDKEEE